MKGRIIYAAIIGVLVAVLGWFWQQTQTLNPTENTTIDAAMRELRSLDRTINQDVLRARFQLINSYYPVLESYRRIQVLESTIKEPPSFMRGELRAEWLRVVNGYQGAVTAKQRSIERFKYRSADLKELLNYLPGAGTGVAQVATVSQDASLAQSVNEVLQLALLYNLTSDEKYAPIIRRQLDSVSAAGELSGSHLVRQRVRTLVINTTRLLAVKPEVDRLLVEIFNQPVVSHEESLATLYYRNYELVERKIDNYRIGLYAICVALAIVVVIAFQRINKSVLDLAAANEKLEERVAERTAELSSLNRDMRLVLDNVDQGLVTVSRDGRLASEHSMRFMQFFGKYEPGKHFAEHLQEDANAKLQLQLAFEQLIDGFLPMELALDQMPRAVVRGNAHYALSYKPLMNGGEVERVLLVVSDVTAELEARAAEAVQREQVHVFERIMRDRAGFVEFFHEARGLAERIRDANFASEHDELRAVHTLKGNAGIFDVESVARAAHEFEQALIDNDSIDMAEKRERLVSTWDTFAQRVVPALGEDFSTRVEVTERDIELVIRAIRDRSLDNVERMVQRFRFEPLQLRFERIKAQIQGLSSRFGKGEPLVHIEANDVRLPRAEFSHFWSAFTHVIRNTVDHGFETHDVRQAAGKQTRNQVHLVAKEIDGRIIIEIADDGAGIDFDRIAELAKARGVSAETHAEVVSAMFLPGISTARTTTALSGRGVGMAEVENACSAIGGKIDVESTRGQGTRLRFVFPSFDKVARDQTPLLVMQPLSQRPRSGSIPV